MSYKQNESKTNHLLISALIYKNKLALNFQIKDNQKYTHIDKRKSSVSSKFELKDFLVLYPFFRNIHSPTENSHISK